MFFIIDISIIEFNKKFEPYLIFVIWRHQLKCQKKEDDIIGFGTVVGVKYTTARDVAEKTINMVAKKLQIAATSSKILETPLWGGDIDYYDKFVESAVDKYRSIIPKEVIINLIKTYGSKYEDVIAYIHKSPKLSNTLPDSCVIAAQILYAIKEEFAETLADVILRRTDLGSRGYPSDETVQTCADIMANEKGWSEQKKQKEIDVLRSHYLVLPEFSYV